MFTLFGLFLLMVLASVVMCRPVFCFFFFFKQKTAYEMRISDWSSDVCSSDLTAAALAAALYVGLRLLGLPSFEVAIIAAAAGFGLRGAAIHWKPALPAYRGLPNAP